MLDRMYEFVESCTAIDDPDSTMEYTDKPGYENVGALLIEMNLLK